MHEDCNSGSMDNLTLTQIVERYIEARRAARYSPHTLEDYQNTFRRFIAWLGCDPHIRQISDEHIVRFMASCQDVSKKTALNYHTGLSSLWQWAVEAKLVNENLVRKVKRPRPEKRTIIPLSKPEIVSLLNAVDAGRYPDRDRALILLLLDTGMRASEVCSIRLKDLSLTGSKLRIFGKGDKERTVSFSPRTKTALTTYLVNRRRGTRDRWFQSINGEPLNRHSLRLMLERIGARAGVIQVHPHRFRHTFAIEFLRNGGHIYALQYILGHTTLDMCKRYLAIVEADIDSAMRQASPVDRWGL